MSLTGAVHAEILYLQGCRFGTLGSSSYAQIPVLLDVRVLYLPTRLGGLNYFWDVRDWHASLEAYLIRGYRAEAQRVEHESCPPPWLNSKDAHEPA